MILYLLDTNALSDLVRNPHGQVAQQYSLRLEDAATSIIVAAELRFGAEKRGSATLSGQLEAILADIPVLPFDAPADRAYARTRQALERSGASISANDLLIAAHALALGARSSEPSQAKLNWQPGRWLP